MKKLLLGFLLLSAVLITRCKNDDEIPALFAGETNIDYPVADFEYTISPTDPQKITFKSTSTESATLYWQLGDDSLATAAEFEHQYLSYGKFKITLTARNEKGFSSKKEISIFLKNPVFNPDLIGENYVLTKGARLTTLDENANGAAGTDGSNSLIDGNPSTNFWPRIDKEVKNGIIDGGTWFKLEFQKPINIKAYSLISATSYPDRDLVSWRLEGSNDDATWTVLDTQTDFAWPINPANNARWRSYQEIFHITANEELFKFYRLFITKNNGAPHGIQIAEWTLNASQP